jgi:DhnA family fructose-bisphosphate aldolase class Ia
MSGINTRIARLFNGKKNLVISALDHVMEYGDQPASKIQKRRSRQAEKS